MYISGYAQPKYEQETEMYKSKKQYLSHIILTPNQQII